MNQEEKEIFDCIIDTIKSMKLIVIYLPFYATLGVIGGFLQTVFGFYIIKNTYPLPNEFDFFNTLYAGIIGNVILSPIFGFIIYDFIMSLNFEAYTNKYKEELLKLGYKMSSNYIFFANPLHAHYLLRLNFIRLNNVYELYLMIPYAIIDGILSFIIGFACIGLMSNRKHSDSAAAIGSAGAFFSSSIIFTFFFLSRFLYLCIIFFFKKNKCFKKPQNNTSITKSCNKPENKPENISTNSNSTDILTLN